MLFLFNSESAKNLAAGMIGDMSGTDPVADGFTEMEKSAIQGIGNIMTSGFIDGWANILETTIDMSTPNFTFGPGSNTVDEIIGDRDSDMALMFDSRVHAQDADINVKVYTFPDLPELVDLRQQLDA